MTGAASQTSPLTLESSMRYEVSFRSGGGGEAHCGAIMRVHCEVRVGTASEGMSRLARLVLLQRRECVFERTHFRIEILCRGVIPVVVCPQRGQRVPRLCVQRGSPCKRPEQAAIPASHSLPLKGNRGVNQIKQSYPRSFCQRMCPMITHVGCYHTPRTPQR